MWLCVRACVRMRVCVRVLFIVIVCDMRSYVCAHVRMRSCVCMFCHALPGMNKLIFVCFLCFFIYICLDLYNSECLRIVCCCF